MKNPLGKFLFVLTFFTRLPLPSFLGRRIRHDRGLGEVAVFFPLVGFTASLLPACIFWIFSGLLPSVLAAVMAIVSGLVITGALHEDGLADCADGLGATANREKALEIMHDSRIGSYGALALFTSLLFRIAALSTLDVFSGILTILISWTVSRAAMTPAMYFSSCARTDGLGKMASDPMSKLTITITILIALTCGLVLGGMAGLVAVLAAFAGGWVLLKYLEYRLGGYTGDGLGAIQQISEITAFVVLAGFWA